MLKQIDNEFCDSVVKEYSKRFTQEEIQNEYKSMDIHIAKIAMDVFRIAIEKMNHQNTSD